MTLRANADEIAAAQVVEIHWGINRALRGSLVRGHLYDMLRRRAVTHLAINTGLSELHVVHVEAAAFCISQLAGVADRADSLIAGGSAQFLPRAQIATFTPTTINNCPIVDTPFLQCAVLN